jgi:hypothetical protein
VKGDDDTLLFVENLKRYLASEEVAAEAAKGQGMYVGRRMNTTAQVWYGSRWYGSRWYGSR